MLEKKNLSVLKNIQAEIAEYKNHPFSSMSITSRCLTMNEINYNLSSGLCWNLNVASRDLRGKVFFERDEDVKVYEDDQVEMQTKDAMKLFY